MDVKVSEAQESFEISKGLALAYIESWDHRAYRVFNFSSLDLGLVYWIEGWLLESIEVLKHALRMRQNLDRIDEEDSFISEAFGLGLQESSWPTVARYGRFCHALGNVYVSNKEFDEGFKWHNKAFDNYSTKIGEDHHGTADTTRRASNLRKLCSAPRDQI